MRDADALLLNLRLLAVGFDAVLVDAAELRDIRGARVRPPVEFGFR
jgi:hypothetical protein